MNDQQFPPNGPNQDQQPQQYQEPYEQAISKYHLDDWGNLHKDNVSTICMFAPRPMFPKQSLELGPKAGKDSYEQMTYPCTTRCPKCNVIAIMAPITQMPIAYNIHISCNGSIDVFALPMPEEKQAPAPGQGMKAVK